MPLHYDMTAVIQILLLTVNNLNPYNVKSILTGTLASFFSQCFIERQRDQFCFQIQVIKLQHKKYYEYHDVCCFLPNLRGGGSDKNKNVV